MSGDVDWDALSYVLSSRYRIATLDALQVQPDTPSNLADKTDLSVAHVSRALGELREEGIVELLVSEERKKGRIYGLTDAGETITAKVQERASA